MLGAATQVEVGHVAAVHTFLNREVEHGFLLAILDTGDTRLIALLIVELHVLDDAHGDILECRLNIAQHKFLSVEENLFHSLSVDGDITLLIHISPRHTLYQFFNTRIGKLRDIHGSVGCDRGRVGKHNMCQSTPGFPRFSQGHSNT